MKKSTIFKVLALILAMVTGVCVFTACSAKGDNNDTSKPMNTPTGEPYIPDVVPNETTAPQTEQTETTAPEATEPVEHTKVKFEISIGGKAAGSFTMELYPEYAPITVANFIGLVESKYYDGLKFHRVIDDFMAQGGMNEENKAPSIKGEFALNGVKNDLKHDRGIVSMARTNVYNSASSQFFICYDREHNEHLDGQYAAFGKVIEGMEVVDSFLDVERSYDMSGYRSVPTQDIVITSAYIVNKV